MAVTSDATNVYVDDGTYSFEDILAAVTASEMLRIDDGSSFPTYRFLKHLFVGQTAGGATANATTLADTNCVVTFDADKVLKYRTSTPTSLSTQFGTKIGTGDEATGKDGVDMFFDKSTSGNVALRGDVRLYGCKFASASGSVNQQFQVVSPQSTSELINCIVDGFSGHVFGTPVTALPNMFNVDITSEAASSKITAWFVTTAKRMTLGGGGSQHLASATAGVSFRDVIFYGSPTTSYLRWNNANAKNWIIVRPQFGEGIAKFSGAGPTDADDGAHEYWIYGLKCVDGAGAGVSGIPVKLTDAQGNEQVDTTTDANGEITHNSGLTLDTVIVADHYYDGADYQIRHRSPFLVEINLPSQTGYNSNYFSHRFYMNWPGKEGVTTSAGSFKDVYETMQMSAVASGGSTWTERTVP